MPFAEFLNQYQTLAFKGSELRDWTAPSHPTSDDGRGDASAEGAADAEKVDSKALPPLPSQAELAQMCQRIITRCGLRGALTGKTLVFLKYYHDEKLLRLMERFNDMATVFTKWVRRFLAVRRVAAMRDAIARAAAEEVARLEREAAERALQERLRAEQEAAEAAAAEAARIAEEQRQQAAATLAKNQMKRAMELERARLEAEARVAEAEARRQAIEDEARREEEERVAAAAAAAAAEEVAAAERTRQREQERAELSARREADAAKAALARGGETVSIGGIVGTLTPSAAKRFREGGYGSGGESGGEEGDMMDYLGFEEFIAGMDEEMDAETRARLRKQ